jgi:hypothetical protein
VVGGTVDVVVGVGLGVVVVTAKVDITGDDDPVTDEELWRQPPWSATKYG